MRARLRVGTELSWGRQLQNGRTTTVAAATAATAPRPTLAQPTICALRLRRRCLRPTAELALFSGASNAAAYTLETSRTKLQLMQLGSSSHSETLCVVGKKQWKIGGWISPRPGSYECSRGGHDSLQGRGTRVTCGPHNASSRLREPPKRGEGHVAPGEKDSCPWK